MTIIDLWPLIPLLIVAVGSLLVLLFGVIMPGRYLTLIALVSAVAAALWVIQTPPAIDVNTLGVALTPLARIFSFIFSLVAAATLILSDGYNERRGIAGEEYPATILFALFGMLALAVATNLLILFLGLEALTFAFYILVAFDTKRGEAAEAGLKYLLLGAISAAFIAFGIALIYAASGTLEIIPAMQGRAGMGGRTLALAGWGVLLIGAAFKVSLVPAHLWTPDVYQGGTAPVVAFLSTCSKGGAVLFLLMLLTPAGLLPELHGPLWWLVLLSMVVGNLAALLQENLKRMLAYSSIAQMGYVTLALLAGGRDGYIAAALYAIIYAVMNLVAFGSIAVLSSEQEVEKIGDYRGMGYGHPLPAAFLALSMFALAGIPPTAGFMGKFFIFAAALKGGEWLLALLGILTAVVSVYFYLKVVVTLYLKVAEGEVAVNRPTLLEKVTLSALGGVIVAIGVYPQPLLKLLEGAIR